MKENGRSRREGESTNLLPGGAKEMTGEGGKE